MDLGASTRSLLATRASWAYVRASHAKRSLRVALRTEQPAKFVFHEILPGRHFAEYTVNGHRVRLEHGTGDVWIFGEIFLDGDYDFALAANPARIADLGGNIGMFTLFAAIHWPTAETVAFEPDPANVPKYLWTTRQNGLAAKLIEACASVRDGEMRFVDGQEGGSHIAADGEAGAVVAAVDVFPYLENVDLLKIDIEGGEWAILTDPRFKTLSASTVLLEVHPRGCPGPDPKSAALQALTEAGYQTTTSRHNAETGVGVFYGTRVA